MLYYHVAHLSAIVQWWKPNSRINWIEQQTGIPILLSEWMLLKLEDRGKFKSSGNYIYSTLAGIPVL